MQMKMKMLIAMTAVLAVASSSTASVFMYENFESYANEAEAWQVWQQVSGTDLQWWPADGWDGPAVVRGTKSNKRRHIRDLVPDIQAAPGGAGMTSVMGTDSIPLVMEGAMLFREAPLHEGQAFYWDLNMGGEKAPQAPDVNPHDVLAFGAYPTYDGGTSKIGLMYYDGLNWTELAILKHGPEVYNFLRVIIKATTVSFMYWDENMSNGMQTTTVPRVYLGGFDSMGIQ